jgi:hypothetical protein
MADGMVGSVYIAASVNEIDGISFQGHDLFFSNLDGFVKSPSAALRLSARRLRSEALTCLLCLTAFGRKLKPPASQVAVYASFVIATYDKYASFLKIAPDGLKRGARLPSGAFYCAVCLLTFYEFIKLDGFFEIIRLR